MIPTNRLLTFCTILMLCVMMGGCATTEGYRQILETWKGQHVDELITSWGPPNGSAELSDGGKVLEYATNRTIPFFLPNTRNTTGTFSTFGGVMGTYSGRSTGSKMVPIALSCVTRFTISSEGYISDYSFEGGDCTAYESSTGGHYEGYKGSGTKTGWYENGQKMWEMNYKTGTLDGPMTTWYENGQKKAEATYKNGYFVGTYTEWDENGNIVRQTTYKNGEAVQ